MHAVQVASALGKSEFSCEILEAGRPSNSIYTACIILQYADYSYIYTVVRTEYY